MVPMTLRVWVHVVLSCSESSRPAAARIDVPAVNRSAAAFMQGKWKLLGHVRLGAIASAVAPSIAALYS